MVVTLSACSVKFNMDPTVSSETTGESDTTNSSIAAASDTVAPNVLSVVGPSNGTYLVAQDLNFIATFSESVTVSGTPRIPLTIGASTVYATYLSGSGTDTLTFVYTVQSGDADLDGIASASPVELNGGSIADAASNASALAFTAPDTTLVLVDTSIPSITSITAPNIGTYIAAQNLDFTVNFSENVTVNTGGGSPELQLTIGVATVYASYVSGSGTSALVFRYTVQAGDDDSNGIQVVSPLLLSGSTIKDANNNNSTLTFSSPNTASVLVDTTGPVISSVTGPSNGTYIASQNLDFTVNFAENVTVNTGGGTPRIQLTVGAATVYATYQSGSGTGALVFRYTVQAGDTDTNGIASTSPLDLNGGTIKDVNTNNISALTFSAPNTASVLVDTTAPSISSVTGPSNGTYIASQNLDFTANFSENVTVNTAGGTPRMELTIGAATVYAAYLSGSGTSALVFRYTVQAGDTDTNGIVSVSPLQLNSGTIKDTATNNATLTFSAPNTSSVLVDTTAPSISSVTGPANATYNVTQDLDFTVNFSENVTVNTGGGTPRIQLTIGATTRYASYVSGTGTSALLFRYTTQSGDNDADGIASASPLQLNSGTIGDVGGNATSLTFSAPNTASVFVQTTAPSSLSYSSGTPVSYPTGSSITNNVPTVTGIVDSYSVNPALPAGLSLGASTGVISGTPTVATAAANYTITATNTVGNTNYVLNITITCASPGAGTVAALYPTNGAKWMDYVVNSGGSSIYTRPDTACVGNEVGGYYKCLHGGEKLYVDVTGYTSCTNLTAADNLGVFDWECDSSTNPVRMVTKSLKAGKGLRDLVNATAFKSNYVTVTDSSASCAVIQSSASTTWWSNTVQALPDSSASVQTVSTASTIYTVTGSVTNQKGINIGGHKIGVVTLGTSGELVAVAAMANSCNTGTGSATSPNAKILVCSKSRDYVWLEAKLNGNGSANSIIYFAGSMRYARVHQTDVYKDSTGASAFYSTGGSNNLFSNVKIYNNGYRGMEISGGGSCAGQHYHTLYNIQTANHQTESGIYLTGCLDNARLINLMSSNSVADGLSLSDIVNFTGVNLTVTSNAGDGIWANYARNSTFNGVSAINNYSASYGRALTFASSAWTNYLSNLLLVNNNYGIYIQSGAEGSYNQFYDTAVISNAANGLDIAGVSNDFYGNLYVGNNAGSQCTTNGSSLLDNSCNHGTSLGTAPVTGVSASTLISGKLGSADSVNTSASNPTATYATTLDWAYFQNAYRAWGKTHANAFPNSNHRGLCSSGTCGMWDYRISSGDTSGIRNIHGAFSGGAACPASVSGSTASVRTTNQNSPASTYLLHATEIIGDFVGDDDGLCESNEDCIYSPNLGAYQGEGTLSQCTFTNGTITGVKMYGYSTNGP